MKIIQLIIAIFIIFLTGIVLSHADNVLTNRCILAESISAEFRKETNNNILSKSTVLDMLGDKNTDDILQDIRIYADIFKTWSKVPLPDFAGKYEEKMEKIRKDTTLSKKEKKFWSVQLSQDIYERLTNTDATSQELPSSEEMIKIKDIEPIAVALMKQHAAMCEDYASEILDLCQKIAAIKNEGKTPDELLAESTKKSQILTELASSVLLATEMSIEARMKMFRYVEIDRRSLSSKEDRVKWSAKGAVLVKNWLKTWHDADLLVSGLDFSDPPFLNINPPDGRTLDTIKEPAVRKKYEDAKAKNDSKIKEFRRMHDLQSEYMRFANKAESFVVRCYQLPPYEIDELEKLLNLYITEEVVRTRIVENVKKR